MNALDVKNVSKQFGGVKALDNCTISVLKNSITAIIGPNGSGKTTLFNVLSQFIDSDSGSAKVYGKNILAKKDFEVARNLISRSFQKTRLFPNLCVKDHLLIALQTKDENLIKSFFGLEGISKKVLTDHLLFVGLDISLDMKASDLSYGQKKLLDLAVAIAKPHKILLLDEPVAGVNPLLRKKISSVIKKLAKKGETIVIIEHDMNFVMNIAEYVFVLDSGSVLSKGIPKQVQQDPAVLSAYLGEKKKRGKTHA